jgi:glyoxylase-like metal-dependent hydrolase (beta-lactamase superfamily II)
MEPRDALVLLMMLASAAGAHAQDLPRPGALTRLADGVFAYEQIDPTKTGVTVNNLVIVTSDGVLVADGQGTIANTKALVDAIATVTPAPVRFVVVGSVHGDHRGGDSAFPPSATFVREARDLTLGGRDIRVLMLGRAHTGTDLEVYLPREQILYASEVFSNRVFPSMANGFPGEWVAALTAAEALNARVYVPAHGAIDAPRQWTLEGVRVWHAAVELVRQEGRRLHDREVAVDDSASRASFGSLESWVRARENAAGALKRVYMELDGQLPAKD